MQLHKKTLNFHKIKVFSVFRFSKIENDTVIYSPKSGSIKTPWSYHVNSRF
jgi:hypothetical protein